MASVPLSILLVLFAVFFTHLFAPSLLSFSTSSSPTSTSTSTMTVKVGEAAPDFSLQTDSGETVTLSQFRGSPVVLFFYPKADTHGCTKEACSFRDNYQAFLDAGAVLLGISTDSVESQAKFKSKHGLPFKLLVDKDSATRKAWGVPGSMMGLLPGRVTYLIDRQGVVRYIFDSQLNFSGHVTQTLEKIKEMQL